MSSDAEWIIVTTGEWTSAPVYYGETRRNPVDGGRTEFKGNAYRYESELAAREAGYRARDKNLIGDFHVEQLPPKPRFKTPGHDREGNG